MGLQIQPYRYGDRHIIAELVESRSDGRNQPADRLKKRFNAILRRGGKVWVIHQGDSATGYAFVDPVPSLEQVYDLGGSICFGSSSRELSNQVLDTILDVLRGTDVKTLSYPVKGLDSPEAQFLIEYGFFVEHKEIRMQHDFAKNRPEANLPRGYKVKSFPMRQAISKFRTLYSESFDGLPWNQPYDSARAVSSELVDSEDIVFLMHGSRAIGFAWLRWPSLEVVELEPFGIVESYTGKGLGRLFLEKALYLAASMGAERMELGVWQENERAIRLYQKTGFKQVGETIYLAYAVESKPQMSQ